MDYNGKFNEESIVNLLFKIYRWQKCCMKHDRRNLIFSIETDEKSEI